MNQPNKPKYSVPMGDPLDMLAEEASEVIKEIMKARRFGLAGSPEWVAAGNKPPRDNIVQEIGDFMAVLYILQSRGFVTPQEVSAASATKLERLIELYGTVT